MSKRNRRVKDISGQPVSSYNAEMDKIRYTDFSQAWAVVRMFDASLPVTPPVDYPEDVQKVIVILVKRILKLEAEWS